MSCSLKRLRAISTTTYRTLVTFTRHAAAKTNMPLGIHRTDVLNRLDLVLYCDPDNGAVSVQESIWVWSSLSYKVLSQG